MLWLSRDSLPFGGGMFPGVCVWVEKPVRYSDVGGAYIWLDARRVPSHRELLFLEDCQTRYGVVPDTDLELIRVG